MSSTCPQCVYTCVHPLVPLHTSEWAFDQRFCYFPKDDIILGHPVDIQIIFVFCELCEQSVQDMRSIMRYLYLDIWIIKSYLYFVNYVRNLSRIWYLQLNIFIQRKVILSTLNRIRIPDWNRIWNLFWWPQPELEDAARGQEDAIWPWVRSSNCPPPAGHKAHSICFLYQPLG